MSSLNGEVTFKFLDEGLQRREVTDCFGDRIIQELQTWISFSICSIRTKNEHGPRVRGIGRVVVRTCPHLEPHGGTIFSTSGNMIVENQTEYERRDYEGSSIGFISGTVSLQITQIMYTLVTLHSICIFSSKQWWSFHSLYRSPVLNPTKE